MMWFWVLMMTSHFTTLQNASSLVYKRGDWLISGWPMRIASMHSLHCIYPFTPKSDQYQVSPTALPEILLHHTVWRTWLFMAYSNRRWSYYQFSLPRHLCAPADFQSADALHSSLNPGQEVLDVSIYAGVPFLSAANSPAHHPPQDEAVALLVLADQRSPAIPLTGILSVPVSGAQHSVGDLA